LPIILLLVYEGMEINFKELEYKNLSIIKKAQNFLIIFFLLCVLIFYVLPNLEEIEIIKSVILLLLFISLGIFSFLSLFFLNKKIIGVIKFEDDKILIRGNSYNLDEIHFDLNTLKKDYENLPYWGNYIVTPKGQFEFLPNKGLNEILKKSKIKNSKRFVLCYPTNEVFKGIGSLLWAAS